MGLSYIKLAMVILSLIQLRKMSWKNALIPYCERPQDFPAEVLHYTPEFVCIKDAYPKVPVFIKQKETPNNLCLKILQSPAIIIS
jgi:hypothetical protein